MLSAIAQKVTGEKVLDNLWDKLLPALHDKSIAENVAENSQLQETIGRLRASR